MQGSHPLTTGSEDQQKALSESFTEIHPLKIERTYSAEDFWEALSYLVVRRGALPAALPRHHTLSNTTQPYTHRTLSPFHFP